MNATTQPDAYRLETTFHAMSDDAYKHLLALRRRGGGIFPSGDADDLVLELLDRSFRFAKVLTASPSDSALLRSCAADVTHTLSYMLLLSNCLELGMPRMVPPPDLPAPRLLDSASFPKPVATT